MHHTTNSRTAQVTVCQLPFELSTITSQRALKCKLQACINKTATTIVYSDPEMARDSIDGHVINSNVGILSTRGLGIHCHMLHV